MHPFSYPIVPAIRNLKKIKKIKDEIEQSIIAGGLVSTPEQVKSALEAGAIAISTSKEELWEVF